MITDLWIENFKGIGKRQHIPLRPITLLFGANSAGKSTVLHALLYLRELVCFQSVNPRKALAGNQTINLGGIENLLHVVNSDASRASEATIGCRLDLRDPLFPATTWEFERFSEHTCFHANYWEDPIVGTDYLSKNAPQRKREFNKYSSTFEKHTEWDIFVSVGGGTEISSGGIRAISISENGVELMRGWPVEFGSMQSNAWWINLFHDHLMPNPENPPVAAENAEWCRDRELKLVRLSEKIRKLYESGINEVLGNSEDIFCGKRITFVDSVLRCPSAPTHTIVTQGENDLNQVFSCSTLVPLELFLSAMGYSSARALPDSMKHLAGAYVGMSSFHEDGEESYILTNDCLSCVEFVAVEANATCSIEIALEKVRLACLMEGLAGQFWLESDHNQFPQFSVPSMDCSYEASDLVGMSLLGPSAIYVDGYDLQRARVDQRLRLGLRVLDSSLKDICYVGPKRSTVPRTLDSDVVDDHAEWGDGLGAWRWLMRADEATFDQCASWISGNCPGLELSVSIERHNYREVNASLLDELEYIYALDNPLECDDIKRLMRDLQHSRILTKIQLRDLRSGALCHPQDVGEGVTQVLPVIACLGRMAAARPDKPDKSFVAAIEHPELHLHPSLAAKMADIIMTATLPFHGCLALIETHSEHLILRILRRIRQTTNGDRPEHIPALNPEDVSVVWVDNLGDGTTFQRLRIDEQGEFIDRWPKGFFSERAEELF